MKRLTILTIYVFILLTVKAQQTFTELYLHGAELMEAHNFTAALEIFDKAYELAPLQSQERSRALWAKGMALYRIAQNLNLDEDYEAAYIKYGEAMGCFTRVKRDEDVMSCAHSMAILNSTYFGLHELALTQYEYAFNIAKALNLIDNQTEILGDVIKVHKKLHNEKEVARYNARVDSVIAANYSSISESNFYLDKGKRAYQNGDFNIALSYLNKFWATEPKEDQRFTANQLLRDIYAKIGDYKNALSYSNKCVEDWVKTFHDDPSQKYIIYQLHYHFQLKAGDYTGALASIDSIQKSTIAAGTKLAQGELLMDKAQVYSLLNKWDEAVTYYAQADSLMSESAQNVAVGEKLKLLVPAFAGALYQNKRLEESYQQYVRYVQMMKASYGEKSMEYATALCYLANIEAFIGKLPEGLQHYVKSAEITGDITAQDLQYLQANARGQYWAKVSELLWNMIPYGIAANCQEDEFTSAAFEALMFCKGLLLSTEKSIGKQVKDSGDVNLIESFMSVANLRNEIEEQRAQKNGDEIMALYSQMDSLDRALSSELAERNIPPVVGRTTTEEVVKKLGDKAILIDFADFIKDDGTHVYAAFILKSGMTAPKLIKIFEQSRLDSLLAINNWKYSDLYEDYNEEEIYNILISPIITEISDAEKIYLVPSGILNQIAIEAIKMPDGKIFGEMYDILRLTNSREVLTYENKSHLEDFSTARLYGGLEYDVDANTMTSLAKKSGCPPLLMMRGGTSELKANKGFSKLKMSDIEVIEIDKILTRNKINVEKFMNVSGTEESFVSMSGQSPDLLLISTHGFYYSPENVPSWSSLNGYDNPMYLTGLVMSGGNVEYLKREIPEGVMGGLLTSSDISRLDLSDTQMVVLSACETALGDTTNEGVYGLQRAFKKAGAQTLVMSLWPVSDVVTTDFMILFHKELVANKWDKRKAFHKAKRMLRRQYETPYYWAAFIMVD